MRKGKEIANSIHFINEKQKMIKKALDAYENAYRRYAKMDCTDDAYEFGAMVQCKYMCVHILGITMEHLELIEMKIDNELKQE